MNTTHLSSTRKTQRILTKFLKAMGIKATSKRNKSSLGWETVVNGVTTGKSKLSSCISVTGRLIPVTFKGNC